MNESINTLFYFHCQTYCVNISPAEEKDLCNYEFVPLLPFPTLLQHPEKDGACGNNYGYHYDDDDHDSESCNDGDEELKTAIRKMREGPPGLLRCSHRPPWRSLASKEPGPVAAAADRYGYLELLQPVNQALYLIAFIKLTTNLK